MPAVEVDVNESVDGARHLTSATGLSRHDEGDDGRPRQTRTRAAGRARRRDEPGPRSRTAWTSGSFAVLLQECATTGEPSKTCCETKSARTPSLRFCQTTRSVLPCEKPKNADRADVVDRLAQLPSHHYFKMLLDARYEPPPQVSFADEVSAKQRTRSSPFPQHHHLAGPSRHVLVRFGRRLGTRTRDQRTPRQARSTEVRVAVAVPDIDEGKDCAGDGFCSGAC